VTAALERDFFRQLRSISGNGQDSHLLDNNATTRTDPRVVEALLPYFTEKFGNSGSRNHSFGWEAEEAVEQAREQVGRLIGATAKEIIFSSGATESNNLALKGAVRDVTEEGNHLVTAVTEHKAVIDPSKRLEARRLPGHLPAGR